MIRQRVASREPRLESTVLTVPVFTSLGVLLGWVTWVVALKLTAVTRIDARERALLLLAAVAAGGVLTLSAVRSGGDITTVASVAILAAPLLITLLTDILVRLVFPLVLLPGLLVALALAAAGPQGLLPTVISAGGAAAVTAILVAISTWIWSNAGEPPLGSGDVLIVATIGAVVGPDQMPRVLFAGMVLGAVAAGLVLLTRRAQRHDVIPYGAFLCAAALVALAIQGRG